MSKEFDIDELLRRDEEALKEKRKRLKSLGSAIEETRNANEKARVLISESLEAGGLTRADIAQLFNLTRAERSALFPVSTRAKSKQPKADDNAIDTTAQAEAPAVVSTPTFGSGTNL